MKQLFDFQLPDELLDWTVLIYLVKALAALFLASLAYTKVRKVKLVEQLMQKDNPAFAISYASFLAAAAIVIATVIQSPSYAVSWYNELLNSAIWSIGGILLLLVALVINDRVLFPCFKNRKEILEDRNTGLAVVEGASFLGTALLLRASLSEQIEPSNLGEPWLTLIYFVVGQALFLLYSRVYPKVAGISLHNELEKDNPAVGLAFGGSILAFSWLLGTAKTYYDALPSIILLALVYVVILSVLRYIVRLLLSGKVSLARELEEDRNWGVGIVEAVISLVVAALLISSFS